jgi:phage shock protein A
MNGTQRFTLLVKGSIDAVLVKFEDPERSLNQLVLDMEDELESAKRAVARAMANEDRLRSQVAFHDKDMKQWESAAESAMKKSDEDGARDMLRRLEQAERQRDRLREELRTQSEETAEIREAIAHMHDRLQRARSRLELLQAQMRQGEARRSINKVMVGVQRANLQSEFDRVSERVELQAAAERSYSKLDDALSGDDLRRRAVESAVDDAVEERMRGMRDRIQTKGVDGRKQP